MKPRALATATYPLTAGVDTKVHGLVLPPPRLQDCINAYIDQTGSIQRRFGRSTLTNLDQSAAEISGVVATGLCQGRLLSYTSTKLYDYSEGDSRWTDRGRANSYRIRSRSVDTPTPSGSAIGAAMDMAVLGNYRVYAYDYYTNATATNPITAFTLTDSDGNVLAARQTLQTASAANTSFVKVVAHGTRFYIVYRDTVTVANLKCFIIDTTSAATIATSLAGAAANTATTLAGGTFDVAPHVTNGPFVAFRTTTASQIAFGFISTAGALTNSSTSATVANIEFIAVDTIGAAAVYGIAYTAATTPSDVYAQIKQFSGGVWTSPATSAAIISTLTDNVRQIQCCWDSATKLRIYFTTEITNRPGIRQATYTTGGTLVVAPDSDVPTLVNSQLAARPFRDPDSTPCFWAFSGEEGDITQPTLYLMKYDHTLLGWANQGVAVLPSYDRNFAIQHVVALGNTYSFLSPYLTTITSAPTEMGTPFVGETSVVAMREVILDFVHADSHVAVEDGQCTYLPGGMLQQYDGVGCTELGFLSFVDSTRVTLTSSNGSGSLTSAAGTLYSYIFVPESTNAQGEREQGTHNGAITTDPFVLGDDTVLAVIDSVPWTRKRSPRTNLHIAVYRSKANPTSSSPHYRVGTVENDPDAETIAFTDTMSDARAELQEQFRPSTELDHVAPPAGHIVTAGNGRVFVAGFADNPFLVQYSKLRSHGIALAFNDALKIAFPSATGAITAMAVLNESLVVFTERAIYRVNGDGLSNTGTTGGYTSPALVQSDCGCVGPRALVVTPMGILFEAPKGKMLLKPNFTVEYIGAPLEKLSDPGACTGTAIIPALQQVRFSYAATTHVYDYYHAQWYQFTHGSEGPTCVWNDAHAAVDTLVVYDNSSVWTDGGDEYAVTLELAWMHGSSLLADMAVRKIGLVGQVLGAHNLSVIIAKDQGAAFQTIDTVKTTVGPLHHQWRVRKQLCSQLSITIRDAFLNVYLADVVQNTAGFRLNELTFELALRSPHLGRAGG